MIDAPAQKWKRATNCALPFSPRGHAGLFVVSNPEPRVGAGAKLGCERGRVCMRALGLLYAFHITTLASPMPSSAPPITAYVAVGANLGDRQRTIRAAIDLLARTPGVEVTKVSSLSETPAVGGPADSPPFLNGAIEVRTTLDAHALL